MSTLDRVLSQVRLAWSSGGGIASVGQPFSASGSGVTTLGAQAQASSDLNSDPGRTSCLAWTLVLSLLSRLWLWRAVHVPGLGRRQRLRVRALSAQPSVPCAWAPPYWAALFIQGARPSTSSCHLPPVSSIGCSQPAASCGSSPGPRGQSLLAFSF